MNTKKLMKNSEFMGLVQKRVVNISIGPTTLRGQKIGTTNKVREYLTDIKLDELKGINQKEFIKWLDKHTNTLKGNLHNNFGAARKGLNIFLFEATHNIYLSEHYNLTKVIPFLETPLDKGAATRLIKEAKKEGKPLGISWKSIKSLKGKDSDKIQSYAKEYAKHNDLPERCYSDLKLWDRE